MLHDPSHYMLVVVAEEIRVSSKSMWNTSITMSQKMGQ